MARLELNSEENSDLEIKLIFEKENLYSLPGNFEWTKLFGINVLDVWLKLVLPELVEDGDDLQDVDEDCATVPPDHLRAAAEARAEDHQEELRCGQASVVTQASPEQGGGQEVGEQPNTCRDVDQGGEGEGRHVTGGVITGVEENSDIGHDDSLVSSKLSRTLVSQECWQYLAGCVNWASS